MVFRFLLVAVGSGEWVGMGKGRCLKIFGSFRGFARFFSEGDGYERRGFSGC